MALVPYAKKVGLIDNKTCSIDDGRSGIRFVVPRALRAARRRSAGVARRPVPSVGAERNALARARQETRAGPARARGLAASVSARTAV